MKSQTKTVLDPILGAILVMYRTDSEIDALRLARARACLARTPVGSKLAAVYAAQVAGLTSVLPSKRAW